MQLSISNKHLQVSILTKGTEICSIKSLKTGIEYMWNADPQVWSSHAPVLFPAIGSFKNDNCFINGVEYKIPKHGFIRHNKELTLRHRTATALHFQLDYSDKTLEMYPYKFRFHISFELEKKQLIVSHQVENLDDKEIHFSLGAHPAFNCPLHENERYSDYYMEFEESENAKRTLLSAEGLISDFKETVFNHTNTLDLSLIHI